MDPRITACVVNYNSLHCCELVMESYVHYHKEPLALHVYDTGSSDGAAEYLKERADRFLAGDCYSHHVGWFLTQLCKGVETEFTLTLDSDIEFKGPVVERMLEQMDQHQDLFCLAPTPTCPMGQANLWYLSFPLQGQDRADHCCTLWRTKDLQALLEWVTFSPAIVQDERAYYDTASLLFHFAKAKGLKVVKAPWIWKELHHFGGVSKLWRPDASLETQELAKVRYEAVKESLSKLRAGE
jgi:hypothetical protein